MFFIRHMVLAGLLMIYLLYASAVGVYAQQATVAVDPPAISIGQHAELTITVDLPAGASIIWPGLTDTITADIEIIRFGRPDTIANEQGKTLLRQTHLVTAWKEGFLPIPPLQFSAILQSDTIFFESEALLFDVKGVNLDPDADIRDIKTIWGIPLTFAELLPYFAGLVMAGGLLWLLIRYLKRRSKQVPITSIWEKPDIPAHIAAISALERLKSQQLWQQGKLKPYHVELTGILRMYLMKRYHIHAAEMTSSEILSALKTNVEDRSIIDMLQNILEVADLVKFARHQPVPEMNELSMELAFDFVSRTKKEDKDVT